MCITLQVTGSNDQVQTFKFTNTEEEQVKRYLKGRSTVPILKSAFTVVRTHNFSVLAQDLLAPTVIQHAWKVNNIALKAIAVIFALVLDICTLPIRLYKCIPKVLNNKTEHPLVSLFKNNEVDPEFYKDHHVKVRFEQMKTSDVDYTEIRRPDGARLRQYHEVTHYEERHVNLINLHPYPGYDAVSSGTR